MSTFASLEWYLMVADTIRTIYKEELNREPEPAGLFSWIFHAREEAKDADWIRDQVKQSPEWHAIHDPKPHIVRVMPALPSGTYDKVLPWTPPQDRDFIRADAWAVPVQGLPFVAGGSSEHPERLLTAFLYKYPVDLWQNCFDAHKARGYTHWILWLPNALHDGLSLSDFVAMCDEIKKNGFYVQVGLNSKDFDPRDADPAWWKANLTPVFAALNGHVDEYAVWEWDSHNVPGDWTIQTLKWMGKQSHAQGASFWAHFFPEHTSWFGAGSNRFDFWSDLGTDVDGLQYQTRPEWTIQETQARLVDTLSQFGRQGNLHKLRFFEDQATNQFTHDHPDELDGALRGFLACCTVDNVTMTNAIVWGYGNGGARLDGTVL